jgi:hypothetical protein
MDTTVIKIQTTNKQQTLPQNTDVSWEDKNELSPISISTVDNYDEEKRIFSPIEESIIVPHPEKLPSGFFIIIEDSFYKVG